MTPEEVEQFEQRGANILTSIAIHVQQLKEWADAFEQRGGAPVFGNDALAMVYLSNDLQALLDAPKRATIARLRTDY